VHAGPCGATLNMPAPFRRAVVATFLAGAIALLAAGCHHRDWTVAVSNGASRDVIVRVTYAGGDRDVLVKIGQEPFVVWLHDPPRQPKASLLDPASCAVLASGDLPSPFALVSFGDDHVHGPIEMDISARDVGFPTDGPLLQPVDSRCAGR
jgi:hypothetical protein